MLILTGRFQVKRSRGGCHNSPDVLMAPRGSAHSSPGLTALLTRAFFSSFHSCSKPPTACRFHGNGCVTPGVCRRNRIYFPRQSSGAPRDRNQFPHPWTRFAPDPRSALPPTSGCKSGTCEHFLLVMDESGILGCSQSISSHPYWTLRLSWCLMPTSCFLFPEPAQARSVFPVDSSGKALVL